MHPTNTILVVLAAGASAQRERPNPTPPPAEETVPPPPLGSTQSMWGQCGGRDWDYATDCPAEATCYNDGENEWYSQCLPTEDAQELAENPSVSTQIITTRFDVPGPTPSVVTTYITIYTPLPEPDPQPTPQPQPQPDPQPQPPVVTAVPDTPIQGRKRRWSG